MSLYPLFSSIGPSGFGYASTAEEVTAGSTEPAPAPLPPPIPGACTRRTSLPRPAAVASQALDSFSPLSASLPKVWESLQQL